MFSLDFSDYLDVSGFASISELMPLVDQYIDLSTHLQSGETFEFFIDQSLCFYDRCSSQCIGTDRSA